jgi:enoyl-[acyl-carrier protein] reductase II
MLSTLKSKKNPLCSLLNIKWPVVQAGMVWVSGADLAAAASNCGMLGVIGAASMSPELLKDHIKKAKTLTSKPLAVNIPLLYHSVSEQIKVALDLGIKIFITSAGSPKKFTSFLKNNNCIVIHVVSSPELAKKCEDQGVDIVVAEGFEAGGHNGRDEITTMCLIPQVVSKVSIPVVAAGGIATGAQMCAALSLGACGVQIGTRFAATIESSAHPKFKNMIVQAKSDSTFLCLKSLVPVRLLKNDFYDKVRTLENSGASVDELKELLASGRAKQGMHLGDLKEGELEIGQVSSLVKDIPSLKDCFENILLEYKNAKSSLPDLKGL